MMATLTITTTSRGTSDDDGRMTDIERAARHVPVEDRPEVKAFAAALKPLFKSLGMSLGAFCAGRPIGSDALSRYINGKRVPRDRYLLEELFRLRLQADIPLTEEARDHLIGLHDTALRAIHPHAHQVQTVTDELTHTVTALRESRRHIASLEKELADRTRQYDDLTTANQQLRDAWDSDRLTAQQEIDDLTAQLDLARGHYTRAEQRRSELEELLELLATSSPDDQDPDQTPGARFPTALAALRAPTPLQRTAAIQELTDIGIRHPEFREAVIVTLLDYLRNPPPAPDPTPTLLPATQSDPNPLHTAIHNLLRLTGRELPQANLNGADLRKADLREANLGGADLRKADLRGAGLSGADLRKADLREANLGGAELRGAGLSGAGLSGAGLRGADLSGADLHMADLSGANLINAKLSSANLINANLINARLSSANLSGAGLGAAGLRGADLSGADLHMADLSGANLINAKLSSANLINANLINARLSSANLSGAGLGAADLSGADLSEADLSSANLSGAGLGAADLSGAELRGAGLREADLRGAGLIAADLSGADLSGADLSGASLRGADLIDADLTGAIWSDETTWPERYADQTRAASEETEWGQYRVGEDGLGGGPTP